MDITGGCDVYVSDVHVSVFRRYYHHSMFRWTGSDLTDLLWPICSHALHSTPVRLPRFQPWSLIWIRWPRSLPPHCQTYVSAVTYKLCIHTVES